MSSATINTGSLNQLVDLVTRSFAATKLNPLENVMLNSGVVTKVTVAPGTGLFRRVTQNLARTAYLGQGAEGAPATSAVFQYGYEKDIVINQYDLSISITKQMRIGGKDQQIIRDLTDLGSAGYSKIDLDLSHRLGFGWSTTYVDSRGYTMDLTCGDGLALFSTVHTLTGSASTISNVVPNNPQFSKGAYTAARRVSVENTVDNLGQKMAKDYDRVITTDDEDTVIAVKELKNATADITSANAGTFNVYGKGSFQHVIAPRIATNVTGGVDSTKRKYWFLASSQLAPIFYGELEAPYVKTPMDGNNGEDAMTENWNFVSFARYGIAVPSPIGILGSRGDGLA